MTMPETFFNFPESIPTYEAALAYLQTVFPDASLKVDRTQAALTHGVQFAWLSAPKRKKDAGCVILSFALPEQATSPRIFASVEPYPGRWMHHLLLHTPNELDEACVAWLRLAYDFAGRRNAERSSKL